MNTLLFCYDGRARPVRDYSMRQRSFLTTRALNTVRLALGPDQVYTLMMAASSLTGHQSLFFSPWQAPPTTKPTAKIPHHANDSAAGLFLERELGFDSVLLAGSKR